MVKQIVMRMGLPFAETFELRSLVVKPMVKTAQILLEGFWSFATSIGGSPGIHSILQLLQLEQTTSN